MKSTNKAQILIDRMESELCGIVGRSHDLIDRVNSNKTSLNDAQHEFYAIICEFDKWYYRINAILREYAGTYRKIFLSVLSPLNDLFSVWINY